MDYKEELRNQMRLARKAIAITKRIDAQDAIAERLFALPALRHARVVGVYHAAGSELDLEKTIQELRLLEQAPLIVYPLVTSTEDMLFARFDAGEDLSFLDNPKMLQTGFDRDRVVSPESIDVMLVPGIAFDGNGNRLGQGGGYYDRYLPRLRADAVSIGIAFDEQVVEEVPHGLHDRKVGYVATPSELITAR